MTQHAVLGASKSAQWINCPGSLALSVGYKDTGSEYADWGTACHELSEWCLSSENQCNAEAFLGRKIAVGEKYFTADQEMCDLAQVYIDYVRDVVASTGGQLLVEQRVDYSALIGVPESFGTADAIILADDEIIVVDLKTGRGEQVDAFENSQLRLYAAGALEEFGLVGDFKQVRLVIVQPRISARPSEYVESVEQLSEFVRVAAVAAKRAAFLLEADRTQIEVNPLEASDLNPGEKQCRWCKAKATCPARIKQTSQDVFGDFDSLVGEATPVPRQDLTDEEESRIFARLDMIDDWVKARRARAAELAEQGKLAGYKLVAGKRGARAWTDEEVAETTLKGMRLKVDEMYNFKLISPTQAEKLLKESPRKWKKLEELIAQPDGKPVIAPESDKRPALVVAADEFEVVSDVEAFL